jgi:hypothetical protein
MAELTAAAGIAPAAKLDIGRVLGQTFAVTGGNFIRCFVFTFVLSMIPTAFVGTLLNLLLLEPFIDFSSLSFLPVYTRLSVTLSAIPGYAGFGAVILCAVTWLNGSRAGFWACARRGLTAFVPLLVMHVVVLVALGVGMLLLIVPAAVLASIVIATGPVMIVERVGLLDAFRRSAYLTLGNRWRIFLLIVIAAIADYALGIPFSFLSRSLFSAIEPGELMLSGLAMAVTGSIGGTLNLMLMAAGLAALYNELRILKEGAPREELAKVFD